MPSKFFISPNKFQCDVNHHLDPSFIHKLRDRGLGTCESPWVCESGAEVSGTEVGVCGSGTGTRSLDPRSGSVSRKLTSWDKGL